MTPLEGQVVNLLVQKYKAQGLNVQQILDNPMFQGMSLENKLGAINLYAKELSSPPQVNAKAVASSAGKSAALTATLVMLGKFMNGGVVASPRTLAVTGAIGAAVGAGNSLFGQMRQNKADASTSQFIDSGNSLEAIINRTLPGRPIHSSPLLGQINTMNINLANQNMESDGEIPGYGPAGNQATAIDHIKHYLHGRFGK